MAEERAIPELVIAKKKDLDLVLQLIRDFHSLEELSSKRSSLTNAVYPLLRKQNELGSILLVKQAEEVIGYVVLCFSYSIEFGGRDAFIDEFFIKDTFRGKKIGRTVLDLCKHYARELGIHALHLETNRNTEKLVKMYQDCGFAPRNKYTLMTAVLRK